MKPFAVLGHVGGLGATAGSGFNFHDGVDLYAVSNSQSGGLTWIDPAELYGVFDGGGHVCGGVAVALTRQGVRAGCCQSTSMNAELSGLAPISLPAVNTSMAAPIAVSSICSSVSSSTIIPGVLASSMNDKAGANIEMMEPGARGRGQEQVVISGAASNSIPRAITPWWRSKGPRDRLRPGAIRRRRAHSRPRTRHAGGRDVSQLGAYRAHVPSRCVRLGQRCQPDHEQPDYWDIIRRHAADHGQTARATTLKRHITPTPSPSSIGISSSYKTAYARPAPNCPPIGLPESQQGGYRAPDPARGQFMVGDGTVVPPHVPQEDRRTAHHRLAPPQRRPQRSPKRRRRTKIPVGAKFATLPPAQMHLPSAQSHKHHWTRTAPHTPSAPPLHSPPADVQSTSTDPLEF